MLIIGNKRLQSCGHEGLHPRAERLKLPFGGAMPSADRHVYALRKSDGYYRWGSMEGANDGYFAIRMKSDIITGRGMLRATGQRTSTAASPALLRHNLSCLTRNAEPLAFINDGVLQHARRQRRRDWVKYLSGKTRMLSACWVQAGWPVPFLRPSNLARYPAL